MSKLIKSYMLIAALFGTGIILNKAGGREKRALRSLLPTSLDADLMTTAQTPPWDLLSHAAESYTSCCNGNFGICPKLPVVLSDTRVTQ